MATSFGALCTDFYINQKLALKMDLPADRETVLHLFDRVRKVIPSMDRFRRFPEELALESSRRNEEYRWVAMRRTSIRTGHVNPGTMASAYKLHKLILEVAPYHLSISPLDVDYVELMFGFDLECKSNHDQVVFEALYQQSPLAELMAAPAGGEGQVQDVQPTLGLSLTKSGDLQAFFEVKTRPRNRRGRSPRQYSNDPISILLTIRKYGPIEKVEELKTIFEMLTHHADALATQRLVPHLLTPIARQITSSP